MPQASKIMIIRHAEKPSGAGAPFGVTGEGVQDIESLLVVGWQRAGALAVLFAPSDGPLQSPALARAQYLFAAGDQSGGKSKRPLETLSALAQKLAIEIDATNTTGQEAQLAARAMESGGVVLISWEHKHIPLIANAILGNTTAPQSWPDNRFDIVWVFDLDAGSGTYRFSQVPQLLLAGDVPSTIGTNTLQT
jgi:hypothetical protein